MQVLSALRSTILFGEFKPGRRLSEQEIAQLMQVSRQPVREAFIRLGVEGLVEIRPQRGTFVSKISIGEVHDSRFVREAVESDLARLAALNITPEMRAELEDILARQKSGSHDALSFMELDEALHRTLAEAAGKPQIWAYLQKLKSQMDRVRFLVAMDLPIEELIAQHEDIVRAVADGDEDKAEQATRRHLRQILIDLPKIVETYPDYFDTGE
ncbi:MAG: GntR family transcriptional regulator [Thalassovita sp.]|nr:GntR family transcriptional regulator [Thalassovita sp.]